MNHTNQLQNLSVLVTNYNKDDFILDFLKSAENLLALGAEIIVVDDGSTDDSTSKLENYISNSADSFRLIKTENRGAGPARSLSVLECSRPIVFFLDIDDKPHFDGLISVMSEFEISQAELAVANYQVIGKDYLGEMPIKSDTFELVRSSDFRDEILAAMGWWRFLYRRDFLLQKHNVLGNAFSEYGTKKFILDDLFWMIHLSSQELNLLVAPESTYVYEYFLPTERNDSWERYLRQITYLPEASVSFQQHLIENRCNHEIDWMYKKVSETLWNHLPLLSIKGNLRSYFKFYCAAIKLSQRDKRFSVLYLFPSLIRSFIRRGKRVLTH
jgi:glycosyltransferase involved in cell wall biosynthesis